MRPNKIERGLFKFRVIEAATDASSFSRDEPAELLPPVPMKMPICDPNSAAAANVFWFLSRTVCASRGASAKNSELDARRGSRQ